MNRSSRERDRLGAIARTITLVITNVTKLAGLYVGLRAATAATPNAVVLAFAAFMMSGAQISEHVVIGLLETLFGATSHEEGKKK